MNCLKVKDKLLDLWFSFHPNISLAEGLRDDIMNLPNRGKQSLGVWLRHLERFSFKFSSEMIDKEGEEYYKDLFLLRFIKIELFKYNQLKIYQWDPLYWLDEVSESIFYLTARDSIPLGLRKDSMRSRLDKLPSFFQTAKYWMIKRSIPKNYYRKALKRLDNLSNYLQEIEKWLLDSQFEKREVEKIISQADHSINEFEKFMIEHVEDIPLPFSSTDFEELIRLQSNVEVDELYSDAMEEFTVIKEEYLEYCGEYLKSQKIGVPVNPIARSKGTRKMIYKQSSFENMDQIREFIDTTIFNLKRLIQENKLFKVPRDAIRSDWSPPFFRERRFMNIVASPRYSGEEVTKIYIQSDDFEIDQRSSFPQMGRVRLELQTIRRVMPGEFFLTISNRDDKNEREIYLNDKFTSQGWGYFILDYLFNLEYRSTEVEYKIEYLRMKMDMILAALSEILFFRDEIEVDQIYNFLEVDGLLNKSEAYQLMDDVSTGLGDSTNLLASYLGLKKIYEKDPSKKLADQIIALGNYPVSLMHFMIN